MTPTEIKVIQKIAKLLAPKYTFGYYNIEDIEQEAFILGMEALPRFNSNLGSLEGFLYRHISNRLKNFLRNNYERQSFECSICLDNSCDSCQQRRWKFAAKRHLMEPIDIDNVNDNKESSMHTNFNFLEKLELDEIFSIINQNLEISLRLDYLRMLEGLYVPKNKRELIEHIIINILERHGYEK